MEALCGGPPFFGGTWLTEEAWPYVEPDSFGRRAGPVVVSALCEPVK